MSADPFDAQDADPIAERAPRVHLVRSMGTLGIFGGGLIAILELWPNSLGRGTAARQLAFAFTFGGIVYLAVLGLKVRDMVKQPERMHRVDRWLCRYSLVLLVLLTAGLLAFVSTELARPDGPRWLGFRTVVVLLHYVTEIGLLLSIICFAKARWGRLLFLVPMIVFGSCTLIMPVVLIGSSIDR